MGVCRVGVVGGDADIVLRLAGWDGGNLVLHPLAAVDCISGVVGYRWITVEVVIFVAGCVDDSWH